MRTIHAFFVGLVGFIFLGVTIGLLFPLQSQAALFKKDSFAAAPLIQKFFEKTVCGFKDPESRFVTAGDKVCDRTTGYVWEQNPDSIMRGSLDWESAMEFCESLGEGHGKKYKLPTVQQFISVLDYSENSPAITQGVFNGLLSPAQYWTSTPFPPDVDEQAYIVQIAGGQVQATEMTDTRRVWCVQGGEKKHTH